jgi:Protein of unknown function (DUF2934)
MNIRAKLPVQSAGPPEKIALSAVPSVAAPLQQPNSIIKRVFITCTPGQRQAMISEAAYFEAQYRGFESGHELEDWLLAESQIDAAIASGELPHVFKL